MKQPHEKHINLWYPRNTKLPRADDQPASIRVGLMDVRAADYLIIDYDFDRDGYRVRMATVHEWEPDDPVMDPKLVEVAFIPAWVEPAQ